MLSSGKGKTILLNFQESLEVLGVDKNLRQSVLSAHIVRHPHLLAQNDCTAVAERTPQCYVLIWDFT